jgi:HEAT repeat protein
VDLLRAFGLLFLASAVLLALLATLIVGRKTLRDRRESASARRRDRLRHAVDSGAPRSMRRAFGAIRDRAAEVDLAIVLEEPARAARDRIALERAVRRSGLLGRLERNLTARHAPTRGRATLILGHLRLPDGIERIERMLDDPDPDVRLVACAGLALARAPAAVDALVRALSRRRLSPERVIERLGQPWAVDTLLAALARLDAEGERRSAPRIGIARALGVAGDRRAEPALVHLLGKGSIEERISAARALGSVGGEAARPALELALADPEWALRAQAAKALGKIASARSVAALEAVLDDPAWWVRANAATTLRALGPQGRAALERALEHDDAYARDRAREALAMDRVAPVGR